MTETMITEVKRPRHIQSDHWEEWITESGVKPSIVASNVMSVSNRQEIAKILNLEDWKEKTEGWWVSGIDPITGEEQDDFGQFKPDKKTKKGAKYLSPAKKKTEAIYLQDPDRPGFWNEEHNELIITEGAKKGGAGITHGYPTITLTGVWNGQINQEKLIPTLQEYLRYQGKPTIKLAFDADLWHNKSVGKALINLANLLVDFGCSVRVADLGKYGKKMGIDDVIKEHGIEAFREALNQAYDIETYKELVNDIPVSAVDEGFQKLYDPKMWMSYDGNLYRHNGKYFELQPQDKELSRIQRWCQKFRDSMFQDTFQDREGIYVTPHSKPSMPLNIYKQALKALYVDAERVNPSSVLSLNNGILEIIWEGKTKFRVNFTEHNPENYWMFTYCSGVDYNPYADPDACDQMLQCIPSEFQDIVLKTLASSLAFREVQKAKGRAVKALVLFGEGNNGKDTLRATLTAILNPDYVCALPVSAFSNEGSDFSLEGLDQAKLNWSPENDDIKGMPLDRMNRLKSAITSDWITINRKYQKQLKIQPSCLQLFNANEYPNLRATKEAASSRFAVVDFYKKFVSNPQHSNEIKGDPRFKNDSDFVAEEVAPAFLNVMLMYLEKLMNEGIDYSPVEGTMKTVAHETDHIMKFLDDMGVRECHEEDEGYIWCAELYQELLKWYIEQGYVEFNGNYDWTNPQDIDSRDLNHIASNGGGKTVCSPSQFGKRLRIFYPRLGIKKKTVDKIQHYYYSTLTR